MIILQDLREFLYTVLLIAAFSITGFFVHSNKAPSGVSQTPLRGESPHAVSLIANPVVHITVPEHNTFAP